MSNRKEDEKNERLIRNLLKLPDNRRCANCNSLGPQYVCINFWTFICTNCSGIHREFTHRVKSISMAKFTSQEVSALQGGGNASAKEIYLKEWDTKRQSLPDGSNVERLRDFIKHVYVERRYTGERITEKPPKARMNESEDFNDHRRMDYQSGSRSPPYDEANERRYNYNDRSTSGGRSPGYDLENRQHGDYKKSPARTEVVNDWRREDRFGNVRTSDGGSRPHDSKSPDRQKDLGASSPPVVRPVRDILGENVIPLRIEPPKANGVRSPDSSLWAQRTESSSSLASSNGNPAEPRIETSLIDFDAVPEPPVVASVPQPQPQPVNEGLHPVQTVQSNGDNWANFGSVADVKISHAAANVNPLESVIAELSVPASGSLNLAWNPGSGTLTSASTTGSNVSSFPSMLPVNTHGSAFGSVAPPAATVNSSMSFPFGTPAATAHPVSQPPNPGGNFLGRAATFAQQPQSQQHSQFPAFGGQSVFQSFPVGNSNNQPSNSFGVPNPQWFPSPATVQMPHSGVNPNMGSSSSSNAEGSERKALPEDLFAVNYSPIPAPVRVWHTGPQLGMGFAMQHNMPMPAPTYPQASKSTNPFDFGNDPTPAATFPSMSSLQGALPTMTAPGGQHHASSLAPSAAPPSSFSYAPPHPTHIQPNAYLDQQLSGNMPSRPYGQVQFGLDGAAFGAPSANPQFGGLQSAGYTQSTLSSTGGNPFG